MAKYSVLKSFYASTSWQKFRAVIIGERGNICQHCGDSILADIDIHIHHIKELTPENVHDVTVSLNPDNVLVVHHDCHDRIHNRFGQKVPREVYLVYGPPLAGQQEFVRQYIKRGDIVVDMDRLYAAVTMLPEYDKPDSLFRNVRGVYNLLVDNIKTRYGKWNNAWVIGGFADRYQREQVANDLGAELVFCNASKEECLSRLALTENLRHRQDEWRGYIEKWFDSYTP